MTDVDLPLPPLDLPDHELQARFDALQKKLVPLWRSISSMEDVGPQTIVVVPSLTVDYTLRGSEAQAYEERFLFLLLLLRQASARLIYVTSQRIDPKVIDYYLGLLPGVIASHARARLHLVAPNDGSGRPLSVKLLIRPRLIERIRALIGDPDRAHLVPFNTTVHERDLALRLGIPMYGADPCHLQHGTKSGCRKLFRKAGIAYPDGFEDLASLDEVVDAVRELKRKKPSVDKVMVKHDEGVSGEGNATVDVRGLGEDPSRAEVEARVRALTLEAPHLGFDGYFDKLAKGRGIVEERIVADRIESPSAQLRITPLGELELISTHDQLLGGPTGQSFLGSRFPADRAYAAAIAEASLRVGELLVQEGVLGRFAIDFLVAKGPSGWSPHAIEINLRKGGTTHPFLTLSFLTDGTYDWRQARFTTPMGEEKHFIASDHLEAPRYRALDIDAVFDAAIRNGLHFDHAREKGVVFHMMAALGDRGRIGLTAVGNSPDDARSYYDRTVEVFDREAADALRSRPLPSG